MSDTIVTLASEHFLSITTDCIRSPMSKSYASKANQMKPLILKLPGKPCILHVSEEYVP